MSRQRGRRDGARRRCQRHRVIGAADAVVDRVTGVDDQRAAVAAVDVLRRERLAQTSQRVAAGGDQTALRWRPR